MRPTALCEVAGESARSTGSRVHKTLACSARSVQAPAADAAVDAQRGTRLLLDVGLEIKWHEIGWDPVSTLV